MKLGVIGGSGLYALEGMENVREEQVDTPFGSPSDPVVCGTLHGVEMFFIPRHGKGHRLLPSEINYRANIMALKMLGVQRVLGVTAVGSLKEDLRPRDVMMPDQYFDRTKNSAEHTFFGDGIVAHVAFSHPGCPEMRSLLGEVVEKVIAVSDNADRRVQVGGTYVNMEGPAFSTRAESTFHRQFGYDVIGMTSLAEAKLCREAEMCYQVMSMITDYDCWHESEEPVTVEMIIGHLTANTALAKEVLSELVKGIGEQKDCGCAGILEYAIITTPSAMPEETVKKLSPIIGKYVK
jgi:5'-methylthioadenosine phosphorylase